MPTSMNDFAKKARIFSLASDETRLRILCFMFSKKEACVSEIAEALDLSVATVSHHLQLLRDNSFLASERMGTKVCYRLEDRPIIKKMEDIICKTPLD